jgi:DNA-binding FadR family transcriptional regulator
MSANRALRASLAALRSTQLAHLGPPTTRPVAEHVAGIHAEIFAAIAARNPDLARTRMLDHLAGLTSGSPSHITTQLAASV